MTVTIEEIRLAFDNAIRALDDAASVVNPGEDEEYAYEHEMNLLRNLSSRLEREPDLAPTKRLVIVEVRDGRAEVIHNEADATVVVLDLDAIEMGRAPDIELDELAEHYRVPVVKEDGQPFGLELCVECGHSVAPGSGRFVNRVPIADDLVTRCENMRPYPWGAFVCAGCEEQRDTERDAEREDNNEGDE